MLLFYIQALKTSRRLDNEVWSNGSHQPTQFLSLKEDTIYSPFIYVHIHKSSVLETVNVRQIFIESIEIDVFNFI